MSAYSHSDRSLHSTHIHKIHYKLHLHHELPALGSQVTLLYNNNLPINNQLHNACHGRIPSLPWPSPKQASASSSQVNHQPLWVKPKQSHQHTNVSRGDIACASDVHITLSTCQLPTFRSAPASTLIALRDQAYSIIHSHWIPTSSFRSMIRSMHGSTPTASANQRSVRHMLVPALFDIPTCS